MRKALVKLILIVAANELYDFLKTRHGTMLSAKR